MLNYMRWSFLAFPDISFRETVHSEKGTIIFYQRLIIKIKECQSLRFLPLNQLECLPEVVVAKNIPFHSYRLCPV